MADVSVVCNVAAFNGQRQVCFGVALASLIYVFGFLCVRDPFISESGRVFYRKSFGAVCKEGSEHQKIIVLALFFVDGLLG